MRGLQVVGTDFAPGLGVVLIFHGRVPVCEPACGSRVLTMGSVVGQLPCFWAEGALTGTPLRGVVALIFHRGVACG